MSLTPMSPSEFQNTLNEYLDFHRTYLFRVMFFDGIIGAVKGAFVTNLISATDTPISSTNPITLGWQGSKLKLAGKTDFTDWKVTVRDDSISAAYSYFQEWREKIYKVSTGESSLVDNSGLLNTLTGLFPGYKKSAIIIMFGNMKGTESGGAIRTQASDLVANLSAAGQVRAYLISGIWPKDIGSIALDYSVENIATFPVNFSVDYFEPYSLTGLASNLLSSIIG